MKRFIFVLFLLITILFTSTAMAGTPIRGQSRVYGFEDEIKTPSNKFAPYVVFLNVPHVNDRFAKFHYIRESTNERHWQIKIVDENGNLCPAEGSKVRIFLPYPSIWSKANQSYWKWTEHYAEKHYSWNYALGDSVDVSDNGENYISVYIRSDYSPVTEMSDFGPYVDLYTNVFQEGLSIWIEFEHL